MMITCLDNPRSMRSRPAVAQIATTSYDVSRAALIV